MAGVRQDFADQRVTMATLKVANQQGRLVGPTDPECVAAALRDKDARPSYRGLWPQWLMEVRELWPKSALADDASLAYYLQQKGAANSGRADPFVCAKPLPAASLPAATANVDTRLPASAYTPVSVWARLHQHLCQALGLHQLVALLFPSAGIAGKHVKVNLPSPSKFNRIAVDSDVRAWLRRMNEYLTISGIEPTLGCGCQ